MRCALLAAACALGCWLLAGSPAQAEQPSDPLAALIAAGAPLAAPAPPDRAAGSVLQTHVALAATPARPAQPDAPPAVELPAIPNPLDLLGGAALDPREWAGAFVDAAVGTLVRALLGAIRGFTDWALGLGSSSLNFVTRTPEAGTYGSTTVRSLWELSRGVANAGLAVIVMWGGFNVILRQHLRNPYDGVMELLPRAALGALALNLTLEFARLAIDANNALTATVGQSALPGYAQAGAGQEGIALVLVALAYAVAALLLVFQMLMRLALLDLLIVLAPVMVLCWVLPQTQGWARWWAQLFPVTVFQQAVQMVVLRLGSVLTVELTPGSAGDALLTLMLGIAVLWLTLRVPSLLPGQMQQAGAVRIVSLISAGRAAAAGVR
ncbi:MAG: type IV secretion system protein [Chloroflexi bacterium]|nr:type IV secretion system protein [Chloroflexota bacterium]